MAAAAGQEIEHHLGRYLGRIRRHTFGSDAVVAGAHNDRLAGNLRDRLTEYPGEPDG